MQYQSVVILPFFVILSTIALQAPGGGGEGRPKDAKAEAIRKELKRFAGTWELHFRGMNGRRFDHRAQERKTGEKYRWVLREDGTFVFQGKGKMEQKSKLVIDPTARPKKLDIVHYTDTWERVVASCIYELDGDELWICGGPNGAPRPNDFTFNGDNLQTLDIWRRVKDKK